MNLVHYTCQHAAERIGTDSPVLLPHAQVFFRTPPLLWLTDLDEPSPTDLGFANVACDRMECRYDVDTDAARPWTAYAHDVKVPLNVRLMLDGRTGARPRHWWIALDPLPALRVR